jgi:hypothetical protein
MLNANLATYQKGAYYAGNKLFSTLPASIKSLNHDIKVFKLASKDYVLSYSYSVRRMYFNRKLLNTVDMYVNSCNNYIVMFVLVFYLFEVFIFIL